MNYNEMKQAVKLLSKEWNLGKIEAGADDDICAWIHLVNNLEKCDKIVQYKEGNKLIGFCGYSKKGSNKHRLYKRFWKFVKNRLYKSKSIKNLKAFKEYESIYDYVPKEYEDYFDGEITILIVDENYRGKGIGKKLLLDVFECAKNDNIKNLQILTDEASNYKFYELLGCNRVYETVVVNKDIGQLGNGYTEEVYIYEKKL